MWQILPIRIHDHHLVARHMQMDVVQADGDGALMAEIAAQVQHVDFTDVLEGAAIECGRQGARRPVIHQQDVDRGALLLKRLVKQRQQQRDALPVVEHRYQNDNLLLATGGHGPFTGKSDLYHLGPSAVATSLLWLA